MPQTIELRPQPGPQTQALSSAADFVIFGGGAGGGKSWTILLEALRHIQNPAFNATFFRRSYPQIKNPGGLWDASLAVFPLAGGIPQVSALRWNFPAGSYAVMRHLKNDAAVLEWQGTELVYIALDELTHFSEYQFWYLTSRMRSTSGITPYLRATCNPEVDSWVRSLIGWWLTEDGFADPEKAGVVRHFERHDGQLLWFDAPTEDSKSLTFIPSSVYDNPALLQKDPNYLKNLKALPLIERQKLLEGNWNVRAEAGKVFRTEWFTTIQQLPQVVKWVRVWDFASTSDREGKDPDATASIRMGLMQNGGVVISDCTHDHLTPAGVDTKLKAIAAADGPGIPVRWQRDPGQAGEYQNQALRSQLAGYDAKGITTTLSKLERANPLSRAAEFGEVYLLQGPWNNQFINELVSFPDGAHDDMTDAAALAYLELLGVGLPKFGSASFR
ncbi:phage terminase large subunit [Nodosilinea sp. LEGE 06152]|uniref:phage terminase large subunit n=1 Tax=Nodosilinea sp. LEGE 06152 TaxID=2777966 RepID=UPI0018815C88|nr:phage terminase large subunit [Nodosilinea sp. LEGE 06152]MBE9157887.1 phage terminase large subunit [Nodosilinea sp. LEGE 06152]